MNDLFIQTAIMASITFFAVVGAISYLKKSQTQPVSEEDEELKQQLNTVQAELNLAKENNASISSKLAAAEASLTHLSTIEERSAVLEQQKRLAEVSLSETKVELSRLNAQLEEKNARLSALTDESTLLSQQVASLQSKQTQLTSDKAELTEKLKAFFEVQEEVKQLKSVLFDKDSKITEMSSQLSASLESKKAQQEKIELLERTEQRLVKEFENTANKIFKEKTGEMSAQNKSSLDSLLSPLKTQIGNFSKQVNEVYTNEAKERHALKQEVHSLKALNEQMGKEAVALTKALKGDNKKQGTWGEVVLERVLQESGLRLNHEYDTQVSLKDEEGGLFKPDVIVHLPGNKDVVIDSKMVLTAYERYFNAEDEAIRQQALKEHINAIKNHIKQLTTKNYHDLHGIKTLDYVLMFIPVEPAFNLAIEEDNELIQLALEKNIMLVSPTNLMVALKTINNMWRVEYQNQNAQDIANKAGAIYDKLVGFVDDMKKLGSHLERAEGSYGEAMKKLSEGRGNLIRRAESMKGLRISNNKELPTELVEKADLSLVENKTA
ncbi:DNA recombination protein RmuC [Pseudoalteromonas sp. NCCP-2140]|uniref:DNA recombination protein RmuC n=1 Tax=Pseudoalteromonas sp. NCCP-2140 TaxID=2942288 RepID=UPI0020401D30|nr:DNA recombination protein RmuC [Pseudoalteromonas sp. NCCP-2140]GKW53402.1 DNA recombination protein RmuC [Pseudoalteromonas sp. NCCP-2140]